MDKEYTVRIYYHSFVDTKVKALSEQDAYIQAENMVDIQGKDSEQFWNNIIQWDSGEIVEEEK